MLLSMCCALWPKHHWTFTRFSIPRDIGTSKKCTHARSVVVRRACVKQPLILAHKQTEIRCGHSASLHTYTSIRRRYMNMICACSFWFFDSTYSSRDWAPGHVFLPEDPQRKFELFGMCTRRLVEACFRCYAGQFWFSNEQCSALTLMVAWWVLQ